MELAQPRKENAELNMEREILEKAAAYFAKESLKVRGHEALATRLSVGLASPPPPAQITPAA
jgi:transposase-like protein